MHGIIRRSSYLRMADHRLRWLGIADKLKLYDSNLSDLSSLVCIVGEVKPDEVYNLAAQSCVATS